MCKGIKYASCADAVMALRQEVFSKLSGLVDSDYWLFEVPHYPNVGDTLIWQGEMDFLATFQHRLMGMYASDSNKIPKLNKGDLVFFQGGGNFGDYWPRAHDFRKKIMRDNPLCRYIIFPQSVGYVDQRKMQDDAEFFKDYNCIICARDLRSYKTLAGCFQNQILLVPDMAFCMNIARWQPQENRQRREGLLLLRTDKELNLTAEIEQLKQSSHVEINDWEAIFCYGKMEFWRDRLMKNWKRLGGFYDWYMYRFYRKHLIQSGICQLSRYEDIYTTRLHGCILSILLNFKKIVFFDNSYGKNRAFYETWLSGLSEVEMR